MGVAVTGCQKMLHDPKLSESKMVSFVKKSVHSDEKVHNANMLV